MYFDIAMPLTLFTVTLVAIFLNGKVEGKLKATFEEREFGVRDVIMLVAAISVTVSVVVLIPQMAVVAIFLFAYSILLFMFTYIFSDLKKSEAQLFCTAIFIISFLAATVSLFNIASLNSIFTYGAIAFYGLSSFSFIVLLYEEKRMYTKERWYLAVLPPALFIILYTFYSTTPIWFPYLLNLYGAIFAILIILYLGSLFTWRTTLIFVGLLTVVDIFLVLVTRTMVSAATHVSGLRLPVLVTMPTFPEIVTPWGILYMSLGLGDFFFAGLIAVQSLKNFGKNFAVLSAIAMAFSFFIFEALILNFEFRAFPGTLMIICGWLPLVLFRMLKRRKASSKQSEAL
ncbi:MAG: hypothetical protein QXM52_00845 [Candidatus Bathyarchaeia archaeon]